MNQYFAKLVFGRIYRYKGINFEFNTEQAVTEEVYKYLSTVVETKASLEGNGRKITNVPRFVLRVVEPTQEERVLEEIQDAPTSLRPRKPKDI